MRRFLASATARARADPGVPSGPPGPVQVGADGAGPQVEHGPCGRPVLVEHLQQVGGVALPPAARVAADQETGQPGGQRGRHQVPNAVAVRPRATRTICCIAASCPASTSCPAAVISYGRLGSRVRLLRHYRRPFRCASYPTSMLPILAGTYDRRSRSTYPIG